MRPTRTGRADESGDLMSSSTSERNDNRATATLNRGRERVLTLPETKATWAHFRFSDAPPPRPDPWFADGPVGI